MSDNGALGLKTVKDIHNDDALVSSADIAQVIETILENQRTQCVSPIPPEQGSINGDHEWK